MKKMKLLFVSFVLSVPLFWNAAQAEDKSKMTLTNEFIQLSKEVRKIYGLDDSEEKIKQAFEEENFHGQNQKYIIPLSPEEEMIVKEKDVVSQEAEKLKFILDSNDIPNGGLYFDAQTGEVFVFLIKSADREKIKKLFKYPEHLRFREAQYTIEELESVERVLRNNAELLNQYGIFAWGIDVLRNRVVVTMKEINQRNVEILNELVDKRYLLFETGIQPSVSFADG